MPRHLNRPAPLAPPRRARGLGACLLLIVVLLLVVLLQAWNRAGLSLRATGATNAAAPRVTPVVGGNRNASAGMGASAGVATPAAALKRVHDELLARINNESARPPRRPDPPPSRRGTAFCSSCGASWCTAAARPATGRVVGGAESWCIATLDAVLDEAVFSEYPALTTLNPPAPRCDGAHLLSLYRVPRTGLGHYHAMYNYFLQLAAATGWTQVHTGPLLALGQHGAFDADAILFHAKYAVAGGLRLCPGARKTQKMLTAEVSKNIRWMGLNEERVSPAMLSRARSWVSVNAPFHLVLHVGLARDVVNGNYNRTGPIYRARLRRALAAGLLGKDIAAVLPGMLLYDGGEAGAAAAAAAGAPAAGAARAAAAASCAASGALFRVGVHMRRGDITEQVKYHGRVQSVYYFEAVMDRVLALLPRCLLRHTAVSVFSAGADAAELRVVEAAAAARGVGFVRAFQPPSAPPDRLSVPTLYALSAQDVIIGSKSGFSHLASMYAPRAVTLAVPFTHPYEPAVRFVPVTDDADPRFDEDVFSDLLFER